MMKKLVVNSSRSDIYGAEESTEDKLGQALSDIKDDFDYAVSGLEKLGRAGVNSSNEALAISETFSKSIQDVIEQIANSVSEFTE